VIPDLKNDSRWYGAQAISPKKMFVVLTLQRKLLLKIAPQSGWLERLFALFDRFPEISVESDGNPR
jgi:hypothetical protein